MDRPDFEAAVAKICAAYAFEAPNVDTINAWYELAGTIPAGRAAVWVVREFMERTPRITRGMNVGKMLKDLYAEWRNKQDGQRFAAQSIGRAQGCPHCTPGFPGFVRVRQVEGGLTYERLYRCVCNHDPRFAHVPAYQSLDQGAA